MAEEKKEEKKPEVRVEQVERVGKDTIEEVNARTGTDRVIPDKEADPMKIQPKPVLKPKPEVPKPQILPPGIYPKTWERLEEMAGVVGSYRLKVPSGWIVLIIPINRNNALVEFVCDCEHKWKFE